MRFVFFKHQLTWPRQSGHDVHSAEMMRALAAKGHPVLFLSRTPPDAGALDGLGLAGAEAITPTSEDAAFSPAGLQARFFSYWGVEPRYAAAVGRACRNFAADVLVSVGLDALPYLVSDHGAISVWYAADEWVLHHLSQVRPLERPTWINVRQAAVKGVYQRAFTPAIDRVWVVTDRDRWAARWIAGARNVDVIPNGVDTAHFSPRPVDELPNSVVFWGRLDFGPNIQALEWLVGHVWPRVRANTPGATLRIIGFKPGDEVRRLSAEPGVSLLQDLPDLRDEVCRHAVSVAPMVSGLGIKNKLLEAAAMGRPILCTSKATLGLELPSAPPFVIANRPEDWADALLDLWADASKRHRLGAAAREWVSAGHSWPSAADRALRGLASADRVAASRR
jgi:glycosyltransferase involved in cell wall biosynthesis